MATKKYRVAIKQYVIFEIDSEKRKHKNIIKEELKLEPPYKEIYGTDYSFKTNDKVKILNIKKIAEYKQCPKCKGEGRITEWQNVGWLGKLAYRQIEEVDCPKCKGRGEVIKK